MSFDWNEYLILAKELTGIVGALASEESKRRSAISRAYYSSYCFARNFLENMYGESVPEEGSVHTFVIKALKGKPEFDLRIAGVKLDSLRGNRVKADYNDEVNGLKKLAELSIMNAEEIRESIETQN